MYRHVLYCGDNCLPPNWKSLNDIDDSYFSIKFENEPEYKACMGKFLCIVLEKHCKENIEKYKDKYPFVQFFVNSNEPHIWESHEENGCRWDIDYYNLPFDELVKYVDNYNNEEVMYL